MADFNNAQQPRKIENIKCELEDNYPCNFKEYYGLMDLILPISMKHVNLEMYYNNSNIYVLIIENMSLGIVMSKQIAEKFSYICNAIKYSEYEYIYEGGMKIITVSNSWDTKKWSYVKMLKFYENLSSIETKTCTQLENEIKEMKGKPYYTGSPGYDIEFLNSLLWNLHLELD